jgi:RNA polymerase sigma factor (sigma-70 family)
VTKTDVHARRVCGYHARISATEAPYARLLTDNLALLDHVVRRVARRHRLRDDEVEELIASIQLKLIDNDYEALRRFEGRASLATYLAAIVTRHVLDERNARWGKWRPSVYARRLGRVAMQLEMLMTRDGMSFDESVQVLRSSMTVTESEAELYQISVGFPERLPRRFVPAETLAELPGGRGADDQIVRAEREALATKVTEALQNALVQLDADDRLLLRMCFERNLQLAAVARALQVEQKPLYRRREHVLTVLRRALEAKGISAADVREVLDGGEPAPPEDE